jgi:hypothetical protein
MTTSRLYILPIKSGHAPLKISLKGKTMKTYKVIQLMVAGALTLGLNGVAVASSINLNTPVNYTNHSNDTKRFVDYFSFSLRGGFGNSDSPIRDSLAQPKP